MKRIIFSAFLVPLICVMLSSCIQILPSESQSTDPGKPSASDTTSTNPQKLPKEIVLPADFADDYEKRASEHADEAIKNAISALYQNPVLLTSNKYAPYEEKQKERDNLSAKAKELYDKLYGYVSKMQDFSIKADEYTTYVKSEDGYNLPSLAILYEAQNALLSDHPKLALYFSRASETDGIIRPVYINPGENPNREATDMKAVEDKVKLFDAVCNRIVSCMPEELSTYDRYRYLGVAVTELCDYDKSQKTMGYPYQAYNCLINRSAVCEGYAKAFEALCQRADLWCHEIDGIHGTNDKTDKHAWNVIDIDGELYYIDLTVADWSDPTSEEWLSDFSIHKAKAEFGFYSPYKEYEKYKLSENSLKLK